MKNVLPQSSQSADTESTERGLALLGLMAGCLYFITFILLLNYDQRLAGAWGCWRLAHVLGEIIQKRLRREVRSVTSVSETP